LDGRRKDGSTFHMQLAITEMAHFGQRQFVTVVWDVTEQTTQELYLDAIIENIPNMVFV
jgi:PAS domain S-box-containing protein